MKIITFPENVDAGHQRKYTLNLSYDSASKMLYGDIGTTINDDDLCLSFSMDLSLKNFKNKILNISIGTSYVNKYVVDVRNATGFNFAGENNSNRNSNVIRNIALICVHENPDDSVILVSNYHPTIEGFENVVLDSSDTNLKMYYLAQNDQVADTILCKVTLKRKFLRRFEKLNSLSYLEAQVDILTRLVLEMYDGDNQKLKQLLQTADNYSVLDIKDDELVDAEFTKHKHDIRELQEQYYIDRDKLEDKLDAENANIEQ